MHKLIFYIYENGKIKYYKSKEHNGAYSLYTWGIENGILYLNTSGNRLSTLCDWREERIGNSDYYLITSQTKDKTLLVKVSGNNIVMANKKEILLCHSLMKMFIDNIDLDTDKYSRIFIRNGLNGVFNDIYKQMLNILPTNL